MKITKHFSKTEFQCACCGEQKINLGLVIILEDLRAHFNAPVYINSAYRCEKHNKAVGGAENSQHVKGNAVDIVMRGVSPRHVYAYLEDAPYANLLGLGFYATFTHVDLRGTKARWGEVNVG
ncbi:D-Ala-D-Ala carboxypeptidase family metallohydrolase [Psychromonas sp. MME2]|uniref:YcbK family protein n=1 Tax=unclassified Psychromonas TaxID=2614957 RepID=UPI00339CC7A5